MSGSQAVDWERLDKRKFFVHGAGIFSTITAALFPLTVIKTRMVVLEGAHSGLSGAYYTARDIVRHDGPRGLYKGFGTVICGAIPARIVYLAALESTKAGLSNIMHKFNHLHLSEPVIASSASFIAGGAASMAGQLVIVPIDVISQRLMLMGGGHPHSAAVAATATASSSSSTAAVSTAAKNTVRINGLTLARKILQEEGPRGLYRGFGASVATFVPSNSIWWAAYGGWQTLLWEQYDKFQGVTNSTASTAQRVERTEGKILGVQAIAGVLTGCTSATLTMPLDVIKTRLQTTDVAEGGIKPTWKGTAAALYKAEGVGGFFRGLVPRMVSTCIWGTGMVTTYEFLKRLCALPPEEES